MKAFISFAEERVSIEENEIKLLRKMKPLFPTGDACACASLSEAIKRFGGLLTARLLQLEKDVDVMRSTSLGPLVVLKASLKAAQRDLQAKYDERQRSYEKTLAERERALAEETRLQSAWQAARERHTRSLQEQTGASPAPKGLFGGMFNARGGVEAAAQKEQQALKELQAATRVRQERDAQLDKATAQRQETLEQLLQQTQQKEEDRIAKLRQTVTDTARLAGLHLGHLQAMIRAVDDAVRSAGARMRCAAERVLCSLRACSKSKSTWTATFKSTSQGALARSCTHRIDPR